jgi:flagellar motor switch protein FliM
MTEQLSQEELDQILSAIAAGETEPEDTEPKVFYPESDFFMPEAPWRRIKIYDFKRPDKFTHKQIRTISIIHETFARLTTNSLSAQLRSMAFVHVMSVDQITYEEFIRSIPTPATLAIINMDPLKGYALMEISADITFSIIDRVCGGTGENTKSMHELTDVEICIMECIIVRMLGNIREAWKLVLDLKPRLCQIDTNPQFVQIVPPAEMVILVTLETKIGDIEGMINICIPYITIEPIINKLLAGLLNTNYFIPFSPSANLELTDREDIPIRLSAEILMRDYPLKEIAKWNAETLILPLCPTAPCFCYLRIGDRRVWQCQILPDCKGFPKRINIVKYAEKPFGTEGNDMETEKVNLLTADAVSNAKMRISVELGTALRTVKEVFAFSEGTMLELDKLAGEPVDVKANGVLIAKGEVVVIDENFGVRITEITGIPGGSDHSESQPSTPEPEEST